MDKLGTIQGLKEKVSKLTPMGKLSLWIDCYNTLDIIGYKFIHGVTKGDGVGIAMPVEDYAFFLEENDIDPLQTREIHYKGFNIYGSIEKEEDDNSESE